MHVLCLIGVLCVSVDSADLELPCVVELVRNVMAHGDARVGEVKGKLANGVGSQYSHATTEHGVSSITKADMHNSAASSRLN